MNATCHPDRPMEARGLCHSCYEKARACKLLGGFAKRQGVDRRTYWREWKRRKAAERRAA